MVSSYPSMEQVAAIIRDDVFIITDITVSHHIYLNSWLLNVMQRKRLSPSNMTIADLDYICHTYTAEELGSENWRNDMKAAMLT